MKKFFSIICLIVSICFNVEANACNCTCCNCTCCNCNCKCNTEEKSTAERILDACKVVSETFLNRSGAYYSTSDDLIWGDIAKSYETIGISSTTYVSLVLYTSGVISEEVINRYNYNWSGEDGLSSMLEDAGWTRADFSPVMPGDILIKVGTHSMIYAGDNRFWDQFTAVGPEATGEAIEKKGENFIGYAVYKAPEK